MPRLLLATSNEYKLRELKILFQDLPYELVSPSEIGIGINVEESGNSLEENARLKALAFATSSRLLSLADDSGLEVDALGGEPGVISARYAGAGATDAELIRYLLSRLTAIPEGERQARFHCVLAIATPEGRVTLFSGECQGTIAFKPRGKEGFGYDPIFYLPSLGKTMAELPLELKNQVSHRGQAAAKAKSWLLNLIDYKNITK